MKCKKCQAELDQGTVICPDCGFDQTQELENAPVKEAALADDGKLNPGKIALLVVLAVAAVAVVVALIMGGLSRNNDNDPTGTTGTDASVAATGAAPVEATTPADTGANDATCKGSYTVSDEEIIAANGNVIATMGDAQLTVGQFQIYYWMQFYDFMSNYSSYLAMFGMDYTQPLDTQLSIDGTLTWQQYFVKNAIAAWQNYEVMTQKAKQAGYELPASEREYLDTLPATLESTAKTAGFANAVEMIQADMGPGTTLEDYKAYMESYYLGYMYYYEYLEGIELTDFEIEAYFDAHADAYAENGLAKGEDLYVDVRHILVTPKGGTTGEDGTVTYSEDEWEACRLAAQAILDEYMGGEMTADSFAALANEHSEDPGSNTNGGLYTNVEVGQMVKPFEDWCFDASRAEGDVGLVKTEYGYHVMYFVNSEKIWYATARADLLAERGTELLDAAMAEFPTTIDYSAIKLGLVDFSTEG